MNPKSNFTFHRSAAFACAAAGTFFAVESSATAVDNTSGRPDILFVLLDDLRWDAMSFLGHPYIRTPNIDRLREQGAWMANAFTTTSICCPSRATFLTGTLASRHGVIDNETSEYNPEVTPPLTKYLQQAGYTTALVGKWHMGHSAHPRPYFDYWLSFIGQGVYNDPLFNINGEQIQFEGYTTDLLTDQAIDFIERQPADKPYFCMLSHKAVHEPFDPAPRHKDAFGSDTVDPEPASWSQDFADKPDWQRRQRSRDVRWHYRTRDMETEQLPDRIPQQAWGKGNRYVDQLRCAASVDDGIGRIIEVLRQRGTLDNTLIVFASDNGYFHGEHRRWDKRLAYEESIRIPMIVVYPGKIQAGSTVSELVTNTDFAPTILGYAGLPIPPLMQGSDMRPLFEQENPVWRESVFYEYWKDLVHSIPTMTAVRTDRYKLITYPEIDDMDELFDLQEDPHEMNNLVVDPEYDELYAQMREKLVEAKILHDWQPLVFPKNLPRVRGPQGILLNLMVEDGRLVDSADSRVQLLHRDIDFAGGTLRFNGASSALRIPFSPALDPSGWPFHIDIQVKPEKDGVIAAQATPGYGFKIFVQDGRPGISIHCKTWISSTTTIDGPQCVLRQWVRLSVEIDYNHLSFLINGIRVDTIRLPLPFKGSPRTPLVIGAPSVHPVADGLPDMPFVGEIRRFRISRSAHEEMAPEAVRQTARDSLYKVRPEIKDLLYDGYDLQLLPPIVLTHK
jgi:N-acetylglucosamine-6-sulfatase